MPILLSRDEFDKAIEGLHNRLGRIEQALLELKPCKCEEKIELKKPKILIQPMTKKK